MSSVKLDRRLHTFLKLDAPGVTVPPRVQSFAGLMEMYEVNYMQLRLLLGDLRQLPAESISRLEGCIPVILRVQGSVSHTTTLFMSYLFQDANGEPETRPDMLIRIYHDSRQAEVIEHRCRLLDEPVKYWGKELDTMLLCRWRMNRFLYKWTGYLRHQGHSPFTLK